MCLITLNQDNQPYYTNPFGAPARPSETVQWQSTNGRFSITIIDALSFFSSRTNPLTPPPFGNVEKIIVDATVNGGLSEVYTIRNNIATETKKDYLVYCITKSDQADAPPKIIITPAV